jgi:hypothetical protein
MAKMKKSSRWGSISGALSEMEVDISGVSQWGGADKAAVAVGRCVRKREAGERAEGQKSEIEPLGLDFGRAVRNGHGCRWGEVVQWCGWGGGGGGTWRSQTRAGKGAGGPKIRN